MTGSTAGMMPNTTDNPAMGPGSRGYGWSKRILISYVEEMALHLAGRFIRANAVHPTNCNTDLLHNDGLYSIFRPDLQNPSREDVIPAFTMFQAMPIPYVEPQDISNLVLFLASDESVLRHQPAETGAAGSVPCLRTVRRGATQTASSSTATSRRSSAKDHGRRGGYTRTAVPVE